MSDATTAGPLPTGGIVVPVPEAAPNGQHPGPVSPGGGGPVLVGCAHGTRGPAGRRTVARLLLAVGAARPWLRVEPAFVDVQPPRVADVVTRVTAEGRSAVVVPLLLSAGYHVHVDVAAAVDPHPAATATGPLGPDPLLVDLLAQRLGEAGASDSDAVVVAAAGSSDPRSRRDVETVAVALTARRGGPVVAAYGASARPRVPDAVAALRAGGAQRVVVAGYLLSAGFFHDRLVRAGADVVTAPLASVDDPDPRLVQIVLDRYDVAAAGQRAARRAG